MATGRQFDLVETMAFDPQGGIAELDRHLDRLRNSAAALDFAFDRHEARNELQAATFRAGPSVVRLLLSPSGAMAIELKDVPPPPPEPVAVALRRHPLAAGDPRLGHNVSDRILANAARDAHGAFETLFCDDAGFLTEGSATSLFVQQGGRMLTPPLKRGVRAGVLRARLLETGEAVEADLQPADLAGGFLIGNSVTGLIRGVLVSANSGAGV